MNVPSAPPAPSGDAGSMPYPLALAYACAAFLLGIYLAANGVPAWIALLVLPPALIALRRDWRLAAILAACAAALTLGVWRYTATAYHDGPGQIAHYAGHAVVLTGVVSGEPAPDTHGVNLPVDVETAAVDGRPVRAGGTILVHYTGAQPIAYGDRLSVRGRLALPFNPPGFDYRAYLARQGIHATLSFPALQVLAQGVGNPVQGWALGLRAALRRAILGILPHAEAALLIGILLGAPTKSLGTLTTDFVRVGMIHVVAISGLKVALVAGMVSALCARLPLLWRWAPSLAGVAAYTLISGATASGLRAALMWSLAIIAMALGRRSYVWVSLALVAAALVWRQPSLLWDTGFELSVVGTAGIVLFTPFFEHMLRRLPLVLRESVAVTLAAQVATLPITGVSFGQVSLVGPLANGLLLPLLGPIMILGGLAALVALVLPFAGQILAYLVYPLLALFIAVVEKLAAIPVAAVPWTVGAGALTLAYYAAFLVLGARLASPTTPSGHSRGPLALLTVLPLPIWLGLALGGTALAAVLDRPPDRPVLWLAGAGQSQVALVQTSSGKVALLDGGTDPSAVQALLGAHLPFWSRDITAVLVSEPDSHHLGGLVGVGDLYQIHAAYDPGAVYPSITYAHWRAALRDGGIPEHEARTGMRLDLGDGAEIATLLPAAMTLDDPQPPVAYAIRVGRLRVLLLNREALAADPSSLHAGGGCLDALILPTHADPAAASAMVHALRPHLVVLPQPLRNVTPVTAADLAPLPTGTRLWQASEGSTLRLDAASARCP